MIAYLLDCQRILTDGAADRRVTLRSLGLTYAHAIRSTTAEMDTVDWVTVNAAIIQHRGQSGLTRVKTRAWRLIEEKEQP